jgi:hypothetical protein
MAKSLMVEFQGQVVCFSLEKIDRSKLYGYVETETFDEVGSRCELATLIGDGHSIVGKGGTASSYLSPDGLWRKKGELRPVDLNGQPIAPVKSTFDAPVLLDSSVSVDEFLSHNVHAIYLLTPESPHEALTGKLESGAIFQMPFSHRGGVEASPAFILQGADGNTFLCVGTVTALEYVGFSATAATVPDESAADAEDNDALDFSLV